MSGRRRGPPPQPRQGQGPFEPPGRVLFRITFNVDEATAAGFNQFIEQVQRQLLDQIQRPRYYGRKSSVLLPCPNQDTSTWFVIVLEGRGRETRHSVPFFIEAETMYLHGYQNQAGAVFEFQPEPNQRRLLGDESTLLGFGCNYSPLQRATKHKGQQGRVLNPGLTLEQGDDEVPMPDFSRSRLNLAVRELAEADNRGSQHRTAQNLLLVIIRFCESIRFRSVRREMVDLWSSSSSSSISSRGVAHIKNWSTFSSNVQDYARGYSVSWPRELEEKTGVDTTAEAHEILVVLLFKGDPNEPGYLSPLWRDPPDNHRRHGGGPGPGPGGAAGGVLAAEPPRWYLLPEEPVMQILGVEIAAQRGGGARRLEGVYGSITVKDGFATQAIYRRTWDYYQSNSENSAMTLELDALNRAISAYDSVDIDVDLWRVSPANPLATDLVSWSIYNYRTNTYDHVVRRAIGPAILEYIVYSRAVQVTVSVTVENGGGAAVDYAWFTTMNSMVGVLLPPQGRYMTRVRPGGGLRGDYVVAVPLSSRLEVIVKVQYGSRSRQPVARTFELQPTGDGGSTSRIQTLQQGTTVKVNFAWNLVRMGSPSAATSSSSGPSSRSHNELRR